MTNLTSIATTFIEGSSGNQLPMLLAITGWEKHFKFLGIKLIDVADFAELMARFSFNTFLIFIIIHFIYAKNSRRKDFYFSYLAIGVIVFLLCFLLNNVKLELGFALGLFAIFGIIRYRTDAIPIKEMTYLFIIIGISVMNALANAKVSYAELIFTNSAVFIGLWFLEKHLMLKQEDSIKLIYEKIENIHTDNDQLLLEDLKARTGIDIKRYKISKIDFLRDVAEITLYFNVNGHSTH
ncbi:DUF4956 domain-containing protein [Flammeovirgaceae bacterium SG7u.111]|nr:DUF4956 domain-containing protein [Flammeovirgaceae bacterium SG7u.132]WPO37176.1 DUF4956 domain-containing protein [Flammeovirgaceae bacterium SG7u.111]